MEIYWSWRRKQNMLFREWSLLGDCCDELANPWMPLASLLCHQAVQAFCWTRFWTRTGSILSIIWFFFSVINYGVWTNQSKKGSLALYSWIIYIYIYISLVQIAIGKERFYVTCVGERSGSNPGLAKYVNHCAVYNCNNTWSMCVFCCLFYRSQSVRQMTIYDSLDSVLGSRTNY